MLPWMDQRNARQQLELKVQGGSIQDCIAYILWENKGKQVHHRLMPVPYGRAIETAVSERWANKMLKLPYVDLGGLPRFSGG
jgi:hypothetical protein